MCICTGKISTCTCRPTFRFSQFNNSHGSPIRNRSSFENNSLFRTTVGKKKDWRDRNRNDHGASIARSFRTTHPPNCTNGRDQRVQIARHLPPETNKMDQRVNITRHFTPPPAQLHFQLFVYMSQVQYSVSDLTHCSYLIRTRKVACTVYTLKYGTTVTIFS